MAQNAASGPLSAVKILRRPSEREALDFDEQLQTIETAEDEPSVSAAPRKEYLKWWNRYVSISEPHEACRDHFGKMLVTKPVKFANMIEKANERTVLGYIRTAQAFSIMGVIISQLMRLQRSENPDPHLGFYVVSVPLACICHIMALLITLLGCYRFFEWQNNMARGWAISGGWVLLLIFMLSLLASQRVASRLFEH